MSPFFYLRNGGTLYLIANMKSIKKNTCPNPDLLEAFFKKRICSENQLQQIKAHLNHCNQCQATINELQRFFLIFEDEASKPVSSTAFRLLKQVVNDQVQITGILLKPVEPLNGHQSLDFYTDIVVSENPVNNNHIKYLECMPVEKDEVFLRIVKSCSTNESTCYVFAHKKRLYRNVTLQLHPSGEKFISDERGEIELGLYDINTLNNQIVTISLGD
ncbi:hypothetical protein B6I21_00605 [candidate division KSB1 bacterium 4572_119]|nr:MAG: hypothetical protein B6I21_00605 [candidate division KSB1 bacterium 4572_119]